MNRLPLSRSRHVFVVAAAFGLSVLAASMFFAGSAQAFTMDNTANTNSDGSAKYTDPDSRFSNSGGSSGNAMNGPKYNFGNATVQFGTQRGSDLHYNTDRMFNPNGSPYGDR